MTFEELGRKLRAYAGDEYDLAGVPDEALALRALAARPELWDLIGPGARRLYDLSKESPDPGGWLDPLLARSFTQKRRVKVAEGLDREAALTATTALRVKALEQGLDLDTYLAVQRRKAGVQEDPGRPLTPGEEALRLKVLEM
jgi:hypothetical protein